MIIFHAMTIVYRDYINISIITKCNADYTFVLNKILYSIFVSNLSVRSSHSILLNRESLSFILR